jgi:hypothetical protein
MVETSRFTEHLERANLESAQSYKDDHIVKLIHAYSLGGVMNLIFPLAATNLDQLLRNPIDRYRDARVGRLESCNAWTQLLGIARALAKIAGTPTNVAHGSSPTSVSLVLLSQVNKLQERGTMEEQMHTRPQKLFTTRKSNLADDMTCGPWDVLHWKWQLSLF